MVMNKEMMDAIEKNMVFLATASPEGVPNVVPIGFAKPIDEKTILIADNYMKKTIANLHNNPKLSVIVSDAKSCPYQFKGTVDIYESGEYLDTVVEWVKTVKNELEPKSAVILNVEEIYSVMPGPEAGKKID